ncbi:major facilitator superfamily transporter [Colletotrichum abscissum]|uniref:Major facilitator superfamily transporter n=1 Tax=Colletotrichum tamarilloi TaxID=1209934 RepID=A0ABQ9R8J7_9PEZI|nr:major facilitator superfamily transporter [Colletotrichum tamarilloi]XP_060401991.1 major facilitator superfamily transporter [Colletotrichum abscissum]KAI3549654.1 major facilitator superfamily transporter [Colletotrichum filicis]KAK1498040.1 major facilitator superfamily transporter [Colletotrichum tamarilloi]KAK1507295.1 major facilitator superfamily transporter [Colletotrichum abscissum]
MGNIKEDIESTKAEGLVENHHYRDATLPPWRFWLLSIGLCLGLFLSMLDASIVATSLYTIGTEFDSVDLINWVALAYTLTYLSCAVLVARASDIVGRRNAFLASFIIFFAFSLGCGFAQNLEQLVACRALQGLGGSGEKRMLVIVKSFAKFPPGLYSITMIIFPEVAPKHLLQYMSSLVGMVIASAGVLGPVLGGILTHYASWRWIFWINGPVGFVSMLIFYLTWPDAKHLPTLQRRRWKELDIVGSFLLVAASVLVVFSFQNVGSDGNKWRQAVFIAPVTVGGVCFILLLGWEALVAKFWSSRIMAAIPMRLLRNRVYVATILNTMFLGFPYLLVIYAFPVHLQIVNGKSSLLAGILLLPMLGSVALGTTLGGIINKKKNRLFETMTTASCFVCIGCGLMTTLSSSVELEPKALGFLTFIGFGFGLSATSSTVLGATESEIPDHAPAQGIIAQVRILGGSLGIAASTAILGNFMRDELTGVLTPGQLSSLHGAGANLTEAQAAAVRQVYTDSFCKDMQVGAILSGIAILLSFGVYRRNRVTIEEQRQMHIRTEVERRRRASAATTLVSSTTTD